MKRVLRKSRQTVAFVIAIMMFLSVIPLTVVSAEQKYETIEEDGKEYIVFGSYEQDGNKKNGKEPIEWEVLGEDKNGILVVSRYILDCQRYDKLGRYVVTWKTCTLRKWLNKKFYNTAFNASEQKKINTVKVKNADNQYYGTEGGKDTEDKIFCLSVDEIMNFYSFNEYDEEYYYGSCQALIVPPTLYAKNKGVYTSIIDEDRYADNGYTTDCINRVGGFWWLRSPGDYSWSACDVGGYGIAGAYYSSSALDDYVGVRPALYLKK